jgi:hypothetical protein
MISVADVSAAMHDRLQALSCPNFAVDIVMFRDIHPFRAW